MHGYWKTIETKGGVCKGILNIFQIPQLNPSVSDSTISIRIKQFELNAISIVRARSRTQY